ncbi:MAG: radical SAM protein [Clostridia bacterium]|nr:radical SAM protein [Clostridia bacterium]
MERYSIILEKNPREIVLLRGKGCIYRKCSFCDYHIDRGEDAENYILNREVLSHVTGNYHQIEIINSGSVFELDPRTMELIRGICREKGIDTIHFESHWLYREHLKKLREEFAGFTLKMKLGLETFDADFRENVLKKGIPERNPAKIAEGFEEANFLFGISGQTLESMKRDLELGLRYFERICVNIMCENSTPVRPDPDVIRAFCENLLPLYRSDQRVDILLNNTDFGVGD